MLHYNLAILMLVDAISATDRADLLSRISARRIDAESWVLNILMFGLTNKYTLQLPPGDQTDEHDAVAPQSFTASLVAIHPYAHHVVAAVTLMRKAIDRDLAAEKIGVDTHRNLLSTLTQTLEELPHSHSVHVIKADLARVAAISQPLYATTGS